MPGPGKKPPHLKVIAGTRRPDREAPAPVVVPVLDEIPEAPDWLPNAHAVKEFNRLARILHAARLLTELALMPLAHLAAMHGRLVQRFAAGEAPTGHMLAQYRAMMNDFGLTPAAAGKVRQAVAPPKNPYAGRPGRPGVTPPGQPE